MKKTCTITNQPFEITEDDLKFYEQMDVPTPTLCPEERMRRRLAFRNERNLSKRLCDSSGKEMISLHARKTKFPVYDNEEWWGDSWDAKDYGMNFDFTRPFFEQFEELWEKVPKLARLQQGTSENSKYTNAAANNKNCYLIFSAGFNEDCMYCQNLDQSRDCVDCFNIFKTELAYQCVDCSDCYNITFSQKLNNCNDTHHSYDCLGCDNVFACVGLRKKSYHVLNKPVKKEEFEALLKDEKAQEEVLKDLQKIYLDQPREYCSFLRCEDFSGDNLFNCKSTHHSWDCKNCEDLKYCDQMRSAKSCMDVSYFGCAGSNELCYECEAIGMGAFNIKFSKFAGEGCANITYCYESYGSKDCFGCVSMRQSQYCIFNKQYSETEYKALHEKIIEHMKKMGEWGEFFPARMSPFPYNLSTAYDVLPLTKEEVLARGWKWADPEKTDFKSPTLDKLPTTNEATNDLCQELLACTHCQKNYSILKPELKFYKKMNLELPDLCSDCRHEDRLKLRLPRKLWNRKCDNCSADIQTPFSPDRPEKVFCERCYLDAVN